jgi:uncharacterized BrkB/YihY/UPF0761 family membrane protein
MLGKNGILFVILVLLLAFYLVIRLGAGKKRDINKSQQMSNYLNGIRILIVILALVSLFLWLFL